MATKLLHYRPKSRLSITIALLTLLFFCNLLIVIVYCSTFLVVIIEQ